jgi:hypothetical protein
MSESLSLGATVRQVVTAAQVCTLAVCLLLILPLSAESQAWAQTPPSLTSQQPPIRVTVEPVYQSVTDGDQTVSQWSTRMIAVVPVLRTLQFNLQTSAAGLDGSGVNTLQGVDDVSLGVMYARALPLGSIVASTDVSLPTGKRELTAGEWQTAIFASQNVYDFRVSGYGQGLNVEPRITWAVPATDNIMLGIGASYHYRGAYMPTTTLAGDYDPGDEIEVFGGGDLRVGDHNAVSADLSFTRFGTDTVDGRRQYEARYKVAGTLRYLYQQSFSSVRVIGRLQHWPESRVFVSSLGVGANAVSSDQQVVPSEWSLRATGSTRVVRWLDLRGTLAGHRFNETAVQDMTMVGTARLHPTFHLPGDVYLTPSVGYSLGGITRFETGIRTEVRF